MLIISHCPRASPDANHFRLAKRTPEEEDDEVLNKAQDQIITLREEKAALWYRRCD